MNQYFLAFLLIFVSCKPKPSEYGIIKLSVASDSCSFLKDSGMQKTQFRNAYRQIEIIENTCTDTIGLGYGILFPGYTGKFTYLRVDDKNGSGIINYNDDPETWSRTNSFCVDFYQKRKSKGYIVIRYRYD
ncbi:MAG: hypothetical protein JST86_17025 [Bacteroidetes bacterium]|nr:hypothetical protein [Bacteroidota bacterium]